MSGREYTPGGKDPGCGLTSLVRQHNAMRLKRKATGEPIDSSVPCGDCNACCRSGLAIERLAGDDPGLAWETAATGEQALARNEDGSCIYLIEGKCSIYDRRPVACRAFDCRIYAFCGVTPGGKPLIQEAIQAWDLRKGIRTEADRELSQSIRHIAYSSLREGAPSSLACEKALANCEQYIALARKASRVTGKKRA